MPKVSVVIATYNAQAWIEHVLESLTQQEFQNFQVLVVDDASEDNTVSIIKRAYPFVQIVQNRYNVGFAKSNNIGIRFTKSDYVLTMNQDVILNERYIGRVVSYMDSNMDVGSCCGKIYRLSGSANEFTEQSFTKIIDTTGIVAYRSRRFTDRGALCEDVGQYDEVTEVFGVSACLALYRREALEDVKIENEFFDEDFVAYKEDVDLAWRLRLRGWKSVCIPTAVAYHARTAFGKENQVALEVIRNRKSKSEYVNENSSRNHMWMVVKCEQSFWRNAPWIVWYEVKKWAYILIFETKTVMSLWNFFIGLGRMREKRQIIQKTARVSAREMSNWFK